MTTEILRLLLIGIVVLSTLFGLLLSYLNLRRHGSELPAILKGKYDEEKYEKSEKYHKVSFSFSLFRSLCSMVVLCMVLYWGALGSLDALLRGITTQEILLPLLFFAVLFVGTDILSLPFQWYDTFVIEARFGFNRTSPGVFWLDKIKNYVLTFVLGGLVLGVFIGLLTWLGEGFWIWFWVFMTVFSIVINLFATSLLLPIFYKLTPLPEGSLKQKIEEYSKRIAFPLSSIMVMDGSRRSTKANAFFSGMGKRKKIVLYDTLIAQHSEEELLAVLAHEVGHYKKRHIQWSLLGGIIQSGFILWVLSRVIFEDKFSAALGSEEYGLHLNLIVFGLLFSPISSLLGLATNMISRKNEYEADEYAATTYDGEQLGRALIHLHQENLSNLTPHPWYVFWNYSHPPLLSRLAALNKVKNKEGLPHIVGA